MEFGDLVRKLRGDRTRRQMARAALGQRADKEQIRHFANYLARIEGNKVPNVGLVQIKAVAKGFGFTSLRDFFGALEILDGVRSGDAGAHDGRTDRVSHDEALIGALAGFSLTISGGFEHLGDRIRELCRALDTSRATHAATPTEQSHADQRVDSDSRVRKPA